MHRSRAAHARYFSIAGTFLNSAANLSREARSSGVAVCWRISSALVRAAVASALARRASVMRVTNALLASHTAANPKFDKIEFSVTTGSGVQAPSNYVASLTWLA